MIITVVQATVLPHYWFFFSDGQQYNILRLCVKTTNATTKSRAQELFRQNPKMQCTNKKPNSYAAYE